MAAIRNESSDQKLFFCDGPGGTGKSFLLEKVLATVRRDGEIAIAVATSGIAALQLMGGRTADSTFKLGLKLTSTSTCDISPLSQRHSSCEFVWDEAPMMHRHGFEAVDRTLRDILQVDRPFGGKVVVLAGDFRQILPVVAKGTAADIIQACIKNSSLWRLFKPLRLTTNMRVQNSPDPTRASEIQAFPQFLLDVGEDRNRCGECGSGFARVPSDMVLRTPDGEDPLTALINSVYQDIHLRLSDTSYFSSKAIPTPLNSFVHEINDKVIDLIPGDVREYHSIDSLDEQEGLDLSLFPHEFLNSLSISGMPPHKLRLKVGAPVILLRNIDGDQGLCNGTRLQIKELKNNCLLATILTGSRKGSVVAIPQIPLGLPFKLRRRQFPVQLAFAMTINKAQGQTVHDLGLYLSKPVFCHGQLYVALSRASSRRNIKIVLGEIKHEDEDTAFRITFIMASLHFSCTHNFF